MGRTQTTLKPLTRDQQRLADANLPLATWFAKRYTSSLHAAGIEFEDLVSQAYIGLCKAAVRWKSGRGTFSTYAFYIMRGEVENWLKDHGRLIRIPRHKLRDCDPDSFPAAVSVAELGDWYESVAVEDSADVLGDVRVQRLMERTCFAAGEEECVETVVLRGEHLETAGARIGVSREAARQKVKTGLKRLGAMVAGGFLLAGLLIGSLSAEEIRARNLWCYTSLPQFAMPTPIASLDATLAALDVQGSGNVDTQLQGWLDWVIYGVPVQR